MAIWLAAAGAAALVAGCAGKPEPAPAPVPAPRVSDRPAPAPQPVPEPPQPQSQQDVPDPPLTPGDWSYSEGAARFGAAGAERFSLRCDPGRRRVVLTREGASGALRVRTTYGQRAVAAGGELPADDPLLDEMAFSRGRFTVEGEGIAPLILPTWPEPARVIDECRG